MTATTLETVSPRQRPLRVATRVLECDASPTALWPYVTNTERLNRAMGLVAVSTEPLRDAGAARYLVKTTAGGLPIEFEERPFEWIEPVRWSVRRIFRKGAVSEFEMQNRMEARPDGGARITLQVAMRPRGPLLGFLARIAARVGVRRLERAVLSIDHELAAGRGPPVVGRAAPPPGGPPHRARSRLR